MIQINTGDSQDDEMQNDPQNIEPILQTVSEAERERARDQGHPYIISKMLIMRAGHGYVWEVYLEEDKILKKTLTFSEYFPNCNQFLQMPVNNRLFSTGGSADDFAKTCYEIQLSRTESTYKEVKRPDMNYKREFHSMCYLNDKVFFVSGSRITESNADRKVESYNIETNKWAVMPDMPEGRHRHSSCGFQQKFIYIFGGM